MCGGGTSAPKTGTAAIVDYASGLLGAIFAAYDLVWLIPVIPLVGLAPLTLSTFCASDPPAMPTFTAAEVNAVVQLEVGLPEFASCLNKAKDAILHLIWYDACQCTSGSLAPVVPPAQPTGSITVVYPPPTVTKPCGTFDFTAPGTYATGNVDCADQVVWGFKDYSFANITPTYTYTVHNGGTLNVPLAIPSNAHEIFVDENSGLCGSFGLGSTLVPAGATTSYLRMSSNYDAASNKTQRHVTVDFYCNGQLPGATVSSCCPPDAATQTTLTTILDLVRSMQRNYHPFGYVLGSSHAVSGTGSVPVSRLIGVKVEITASPFSLRVLPGNPPYVKDLGWLSVSEVDGMIQERRVSQTLFTWFPQLMPIADHINYDLFPGVFATITELEPEA